MTATEKTFEVTYRVLHHDSPWANVTVPVGETFTEILEGRDLNDALDIHGGFEWAEYDSAIEINA